VGISNFIYSKNYKKTLSYLAKVCFKKNSNQVKGLNNLCIIPLYPSWVGVRQGKSETLNPYIPFLHALQNREMHIMHICYYPNMGFLPSSLLRKNQSSSLVFYLFYFLIYYSPETLN
jgi:hypothetical protein